MLEIVLIDLFLVLTRKDFGTRGEKGSAGLE